MDTAEPRASYLPNLPADVQAVLDRSPCVLVPKTREELVELALGGHGASLFEVAYDVPGEGRIVEANVVRCRNGVAVNYTEAYMRRRDPDCMVVGDDRPTDKPRFADRFGNSFESLRASVLEWLANQHLLVIPFHAGGSQLGIDAVLIAPANAAFFAVALADLQRMIPPAELCPDFKPRAVIFLAPPFRHTHCNGRQVVVHNRAGSHHEVFSLNLYPGPSAKKGIYGVLLNIGEDEGWLTTHSSTVQVVTPYDNILAIMHEGASGGGKSEMLEYPHREPDGRLLLGENLVTGEKRHVALPQSCVLRPVTDDMALCHPTLQRGSRKLVVKDAEDAWFIRLNHIAGYGTDPSLERLCVHAAEPIVFLNIHAVPGATCLIWEHTEDAPGKPCPNPRVILGRHLVPGVVNDPVEVDVRSFGVRTPPCSRQQPSFGILGMLHFLPPALAWLWRLVAPRGYSNPSVTDCEDLVSEGVGSYWPFATGRRVVHANLLLRQIVQTPSTRYILVPNQHIGCWRTGFMPQWITREYLARRGGARFRADQLRPARCGLLGYAISSMHVEGTQIPQWLLEVHSQPEVGDDGYDAGAAMLAGFFRRELQPYLAEDDLDPLGREVITCCLESGTLEDYLRLMPIG